MAGAFDAGTVTGRLILDLNDWSASVEKAKADTTSLAGVINAKKDDIEKLGKTFTAIGGAIVIALGAAIKKTADYGDEIGKASQKTGVAVNVLSGLSTVAEKSGLNISEFSVVLAKMSRNIGDAVSGNKEMQATLTQLGIKATDASGKMRPMDDLLGDVAESFSKMPDGVEKSRAAVDIFGKAGMQLIPTLNAGRAGLQAEREEAERLGLVLSEKAAKQSEVFNDQLTTLNRSVMGIGMVIGQALIPIVKKGAEIFTEIATVVRRVMEIFPPLTNAITIVIGAFGGLMAVVGPLLYLLPKLSSAWLTMSNLIPVMGARLVALDATMSGSLPVYAAIAAAIYAVVKAIDYYSAACDAAIDDIYKVAAENKRNWDFIGETIRGSNEKIKASIQAARIRLTEFGYTSEEIGAIIFRQFGRVSAAAVKVRVDTEEMVRAVMDVQASLTDKIKSLTLNEYDYRIFQAKKYYSEQKAQAEGSALGSIIAMQAEAAEAVEISKIKQEQAQAAAEKHKSMASEAFTAWADFYTQLKSFISSSVKAIDKELDKIPKMVGAIVMNVKAGWNSVTTELPSKFQQAVDKINAGVAKFSEKFGGMMSAALQSFSMLTQAMSQQSAVRFQKEAEMMDAEYEKKRKAIEDSLMSEEDKSAALAALDEEYAKKKRILEIKQAEATKKSAITQALINTALAVVSALSTKPFIPMGLIAAVAAAAAGAIQIGIIKSTPLPQLAEGGLATSATHAIVGEAGPEAILPMGELKRMLGISTRKNQAGSRTVNLNINAIDTRSMEGFTRRTIIPEIMKAMSRETLTVAPNAVR